MTNPDWTASPIWSAAGWTMLHFLWVGGILVVLAGLGRLLLRPVRAEVRYAYGLSCLAILAIAPLGIAIPLLAASSPPGPRLEGFATLPPALASEAGLAGREGVDPPVLPMPDRVRPALATARVDHDLRPAVPMRAMAILVAYLPYLWLVGAPITFAYLAAGLAGAERLRRQSLPVVDLQLCELCRRLADALGLARRVALATCDRLAAPVLVGIVRPAILLPTAALTGWSPDQLEMALLHELVHVRRRDNLVLLLQRVVESLLFFHPAVWIVSGWIHREREHCYDQAVVRHTGRPLAYAEALLALADSQPSSRRPAVVAMARGDLVDRIRRLLDQEEPSMRLPRTTIALAASMLLAPALLMGAQAALSRLEARPRGDEEAARNRDDRAPEVDERRRQALRRVVAEALKTIEESEEKPDSSMLINIAQTQAKLGDREAALETLRRASRAAAEAKQWVVRRGNTISRGISSGEQLQRVGHLQAELGDEQGALESLRLALQAKDDQEDGSSRIETLAKIAKEMTLLKAHDEARKVAERADREVEAMGKAMHDQSVLPQLAAAHVAAGDIDGAFLVLDSVTASQKHDIIKQLIIGRSLGVMAEATETADRETARTLFHRLVERLEQVPMADDKYFALSDIAHGLAKIGEFESAMAIARLIGEGPRRVDYDMRDGKSYAMLLIAYEQRKAGDIEAARTTLREAYETTKVLDESRGRSGRLEQVAGGMIAAGDLAGAIRCVEDMRPGQRYDALAEIAVSRKRGGEDEAARALFLRAIEDADSSKGHRPRPGVDVPKIATEEEPDDARWSAQVARAVAKIQAMSGEIEAARKTADSIPDPAWRGFALADVARVQAAAGDAEGALEWCRSLKPTKSRPSPLEAIIQGIADYERQRDNPAP